MMRRTDRMNSFNRNHEVSERDDVNRERERERIEKKKKQEGSGKVDM